MMPTLAHSGDFRIYTFGVFLALAFFVCLFWYWRLGRDEHFDEKELFDSGFTMMFVFLVTARIGYIIKTWPAIQTLLQWFSLLSFPGLHFAFGLFGAIVSLWLIARQKRWEIPKIFDIFAVVAALGISIASLGSWLNGVNPGKAMGRIGWQYPGFVEPRFPVDLLSLVTFALLFWLLSRVRSNFRFYEWYKGEKGEPVEGLAYRLFLGGAGVYYLIRSIVDDGLSSWGSIPVMSVVGLLLILYSGISVYVSSGLRQQRGRFVLPSITSLWRHRRFQLSHLQDRRRLL